MSLFSASPLPHRSLLGAIDKAAARFPLLIDDCCRRIARSGALSIYLFCFKKYIVLTNFGMKKTTKNSGGTQKLADVRVANFRNGGEYFQLLKIEKKIFTTYYVTTEVSSVKETPVKKIKF